jgi:outer membrane biosynthesis protein TonB
VDVIQDVGAYAGFAAVVGLAVLSALYFSQARDLRRLREWAGRAPERAAEQGVTAPEQAAQEASRPTPTGAVRPIPAAKPAEAKPGAAPGKPAPAATPAGKPVGDKPAPAGAPPVPATPAAATAAKPAAAGAATADGPAAPAPTGPGPATPAAKPGGPKEPGTAEPDADKQPDKPDTAEEPSAPAKPAAPPVPAPAARPKPPPVLPARPAPPVRSPAAAASTAQSTAVLPASARGRDRGRRGVDSGNGLSARYIALIVAGVIVVGGGVVFGISQLGGDDEASSPAESGQDAAQAPINPSTVTVSVLNGTTVPGLAAQIGDEVESAGFQRGNVANALDQQRTTSVVLYAEGADREARLVARRLGINAIEPVDPDSQALGGNASVIVVVGADQTS